MINVTQAALANSLAIRQVKREIRITRFLVWLPHYRRTLTMLQEWQDILEARQAFLGEGSRRKRRKVA